MGRGSDIVVGCPRGGANVFLILEVTIIEITGINASRMANESGLKLLGFK
jgi:predicted DNA-binding protein with PD1-like motif